MKRWIALVSLTAALAASGSLARADDDAPAPDAQVEQAKQRAQALLAEGNALLDRGDHLGALGKFEEAYAAFPSPRLLVAIGSASWDLGRFTAAAEAFEEFLAKAEPDDPLRSEVEGHLKKLDAVTGRLAITVDVERPVILVDGKRVASGEQTVTVRVDPGEHTIIVNKPDYQTATNPVAVQSGQTLEVAIELTPVPVAEPRVVREIVVRDRVVSTRGKLGAALHVVADPEGPGGAVLAGASYGVLERVDIAGGAIIGPHAGAYASATLYMARGSVRPIAVAATPTFVVDGEVRPGLRGAIGVEWIPTMRLSLMVQLAVEHYPTAADDQVDTLFAPSFGVVSRL